ncbi:MAG: hypothetical protein WC373_01780 [Smithella sp.]|jgi:hypothetical protein
MVKNVVGWFERLWNRNKGKIVSSIVITVLGSIGWNQYKIIGPTESKLIDVKNTVIENSLKIDALERSEKRMDAEFQEVKSMLWKILNRIDELRLKNKKDKDVIQLEIEEPEKCPKCGGELYCPDPYTEYAFYPPCMAVIGILDDSMVITANPMEASYSWSKIEGN